MVISRTTFYITGILNEVCLDEKTMRDWTKDASYNRAV